MYNTQPLPCNSRMMENKTLCYSTQRIWWVCELKSISVKIKQTNKGEKSKQKKSTWRIHGIKEWQFHTEQRNKLWLSWYDLWYVFGLDTHICTQMVIFSTHQKIDMLQTCTTQSNTIGLAKKQNRITKTAHSHTVH